MRFFFDNNLSHRLASAVHQLITPKGEAYHLQTLFEPNVQDVDWITKLGQEKDWVVICGDSKIMKRPHERLALQQARLVAFFLKPGWTKLPFWDQAYKLIQWWPNITSMAERVAPPASFLIPVKYNGKIEQVNLL